MIVSYGGSDFRRGWQRSLANKEGGDRQLGRQLLSARKAVIVSYGGSDRQLGRQLLSARKAGIVSLGGSDCRLIRKVVIVR